MPKLDAFLFFWSVLEKLGVIRVSWLKISTRHICLFTKMSLFVQLVVISVTQIISDSPADYIKYINKRAGAKIGENSSVRSEFVVKKKRLNEYRKNRTLPNVLLKKTLSTLGHIFTTFIFNIRGIIPNILNNSENDIFLKYLGIIPNIPRVIPNIRNS